MNHLTEIIENCNYSQLDEEILKHLAIEFYYNSSDNVILEKYGVFDDCIQISDYIEKKINSYKLNKHITINIYKIFPSAFVKTVIINMNHSEKTDAEYLIDKSIMSSDGIFDSIELNVYTKLNSKHIEISDLISHELTHAYDDLMTINLEQSFKNHMHSIKYKSISNYRKKDKGKYLISLALYLIDEYEKNAYVSQLINELNKIKDKVKNPNDALKLLKKNSQIYQAYDLIFNIFKQYEEHTLEQQLIDDVVEEYNKIHNTNYNADIIFDRLIKWFDKTKNILIHKIIRACSENLDCKRTVLGNNYIDINEIKQNANYEIDC